MDYSERQGTAKYHLGHDLADDAPRDDFEGGRSAEKKSLKISGSTKMATFKHQIDEKRRATALARYVEYLGTPPLHQDLRQVSCR